MRHQVMVLVGTRHLGLSHARTSPGVASAAHPPWAAATTSAECAAAVGRLMSSRADRSPCDAV